jgi:hypothetical protein
MNKIPTEAVHFSDQRDVMESDETRSSSWWVKKLKVAKVNT